MKKTEPQKPKSEAVLALLRRAADKLMPDEPKGKNDV